MWVQYDQYICTKPNVTNPVLIFHRQRSLNTKGFTKTDIENEEMEIVMNSMIYGTKENSELKTRKWKVSGNSLNINKMCYMALIYSKD